MQRALSRLVPQARVHVRAMGMGSMESTETKRARLYYQSKKRGILENDLLLGGFADANIKHLSDHELSAYEQVVSGDYNEWDIYYWLTGKKEAPVEIDRGILEKLKNYTLKEGKVYWYQKGTASSTASS